MEQKKLENTEDEELFRRVRLLGGSLTKVDKNAIIGYCHNDIHKGYISVSLLNEHDCVGKQCTFFHKFEESPYWIRKSRKEEADKIAKEKAARRKENRRAAEENLARKNANMVSRAKEIAKSHGFDKFEIISIHTVKTSGVIFYISDKNENDWYEYRELAFWMNKIFNKKFELRHAKLPDGSYATIYNRPKKR